MPHPGSVNTCLNCKQTPAYDYIAFCDTCLASFKLFPLTNKQYLMLFLDKPTKVIQGKTGVFINYNNRYYKYPMNGFVYTGIAIK